MKKKKMKCLLRMLDLMCVLCSIPDGPIFVSIYKPAI